MRHFYTTLAADKSVFAWGHFSKFPEQSPVPVPHSVPVKPVAAQLFPIDRAVRVKNMRSHVTNPFAQIHYPLFQIVSICSGGMQVIQVASILIK